MDIGEPSYKKCPHCKKKLEYYNGPYFTHYYGLTEWSDGATFEEMPSLKETKLQKCNFCNNFYWYSQMDCNMAFKDYCDAIIYFEKLYSRKTFIDFIFPSLKGKRLLYIRLNILRKCNDKIRTPPLSNVPNKRTFNENEKSIFINNAIKLIELLKKIEPSNHFLLAELYRNIGSFEESKAELNKVSDDKKKRLLLKAIEKRNCDVITIIAPKPHYYYYYLPK